MLLMSSLNGFNKAPAKGREAEAMLLFGDG